MPSSPGVNRASSPTTSARRARHGAPWLLLATTGVLLPLAGWLGLYFGVQTEPGQELLRRRLALDALPGRIVFRRLRWGPDPTAVHALDVAVRDRLGRIVLSAQVLSGRLDATEALTSRTLRFHDLSARGYGVHLRWDEAGRFNLTRALSRPEPEEPERERPARGTLRFDGVRLVDGRVTLDWPDWGLRFDDVGASGRVRADASEGLAIDAALDGGRSRAHWGGRRERIRFAGIAIRGFRWRGHGFRVERLELRGRERPGLELAGRADFAEAPRIDAWGHADLGPGTVAPRLRRWLPEGLAMRALEARLRGRRIAGRIRRARLPRVVTGPFRARGLDLPLRFDLEPSGLMPRASFHTQHARARRLEGPEGVAAERLRLGRVDVRLRGHADVRVERARARRLRLPAGEVGHPSAHGRMRVGLGGGELHGEVRTDEGNLAADGRVELKLLKREAAVEVDLVLQRFVGAMARTLLEALPADVGRFLEPPLDGRAAFEGRVHRRGEGDGPPWRLGMRLIGADLDGRGRVRYREGRWRVSGRPEGAAP